MSFSFTTWEQFFEVYDLGFDKPNTMFWLKIDQEISIMLIQHSKYKNLAIDFDSLDLDDIKQNVIMSLLKYSSKLSLKREEKIAKGSFKSYLRTMAIHEFIDWLKKNNKSNIQRLGRFEVPITLEEESQDVIFINRLKRMVLDYAKTYVLNHEKISKEEKSILIRCFNGCRIAHICGHETSRRITEIRNRIYYHRHCCAKSFMKFRSNVINKHRLETYDNILIILGQK